MRSRVFASIAVLLAAPLWALGGPKEDVAAAAKKLGEQKNYSWKTTVVVPAGARFRPGPSEGKTEKDGFTHVSMTFGDNTAQVVFKGDKVALTDQEGSWRSAADLEGAEGPMRFWARIARNLRPPAAQAAELASFAAELKKDGDALAGDLTEEGAKSLLRFRRRGDDAPAASNARGSVKFWLNDGALVKYEFKVQGTINFGGNDVDIDRTTTVEITDVGKTKLDVSDAAKKVLE